jgi:hypothetical protein
MSTIQDILLVEDSQNDIDLALYALREGNLANRICVVRDLKPIRQEAALESRTPTVCGRAPGVNPK